MWSFEKTELEGVVIVTPPVFRDDRGYFLETYHEGVFRENGIAHPFVQDNHSLSVKASTLRGIHFQTAPAVQAKLIRCLKGAILDVAVDLRRSSPSFGRWVMVELSPGNRRQLYIPAGFGHAFLTREDATEVAYKVSAPYSRSHDRTLRWDDPRIGIDWPLQGAPPILSDKDATAPTLADGPPLFD